MTKGINRQAKADNLKAPPRKQIVNWILEAWAQLTPELISKSFLVSGLTANDDQWDQIACFKEHKSCSGGLATIQAAMAEQNEEEEKNPFLDATPDEDPLLIINDEDEDEDDIDIETL